MIRMPSSTHRRLLALGGLTLVALGAHASWDGKVDSVYFYSRSSGPLASDRGFIDFGRVPQPSMLPGWNKELDRAGTPKGFDKDDQGRQTDDLSGPDNEMRYLVSRARNLEAAGHLRRALGLYREGKANAPFLRDRQELFESVQFSSRVNGLNKYLRARYLTEKFTPARVKQAIEELESEHCDPRLVPHVEYFLADVHFPADGFARADAFYKVFKDHPSSARAESALITSIRSLLSQSNRKTPTPTERLIATRRCNELLAKFPHSRFKPDVLGWQGRILFLSGNYAGAVNQYLKLAKSSYPGAVRWKAFDSIVRLCQIRSRPDLEVIWGIRQFVASPGNAYRDQAAINLSWAFGFLSPPQAKAVQRRIRTSEDLIEGYLAFRIEYTRLTPRQEANLLAFANESLSHYRTPSPALLARVAQLNYNLGMYRPALRMAKTAFARATEKESKCRALYVIAGSQNRLGQWRASARSFEELVRSDGPNYLKQSAMEALALNYAQHGQDTKALEIYLRLGYRYDIAYLADAKISPRKLEAFLAHPIPNGPDHSLDVIFNTVHNPGWRNVLTYTLGMRYLRKEMYSDARRIFAKIDRTTRMNYGLSVSDRETLAGDGSVGYETAPPIRDPITVVNKLERLSRIATHGRTADQRATALYEKAAYIYGERSLLFYSPGLWWGERAFMFDGSWSGGESDNKAIMRTYLNEHECVAHSLRLFDELVQKYPKSRWVPNALYSAALSAGHFQRICRWWPGGTQKLAKIELNRYTRLIHDFPESALAISAKKYKGVALDEARGIHSY